jgi:hypothetical protein
MARHPDQRLGSAKNLLRRHQLQANERVLQGGSRLIDP